MADAARKLMTVAEFLRWDDGTDTRYHLVEGQPVPCQLEYLAHGAVLANLCVATQCFRPPWRAIMRFGVVPQHRRETFYIADFIVTTAPIRGDAQFASSPQILFEVMSPLTAALDCDLKIPDFRDVPSVTDIVLISLMARQVEHWRQENGSWRAEMKSQGDALNFPSAGVSMPICDIYGDQELLPAHVVSHPRAPIYAS